MCDGIIHEFGAAGSQFIGTTDADGNWFCDVERLGAVNNDKGAVLLLGTAFLFVNWLEEVERRGMQIPLPTGSRIMETGGYKGRSREMSKVELHSKLEKAFGLVPGAVFTEYGMSELSSQAYEVPGLSPAELEFPPWTRSRVISPETGNEVGVGETGLIQVLDLANVWSACAIQTEDLGVRGEAGFKLIGRATGAEARGCSLMTL